METLESCALSGLLPSLAKRLLCCGMGTANEDVDAMISHCLSDSRRVLDVVWVQDP